MGSSARQLSPTGQKIFLAVFFLISCSVGLSLWIPGFLLPVLRWSARKKWKETPCTIVKTPLDGGGGGLEFRYEVDGESYAASEGGDLGFFSSPSDRIVELQSGASAVCYVNPWAPREAILSRDLDPQVFFWCAPLLFVLLPLAALIVGLLRLGRPPPQDDPAPAATPTGSVLLLPESRRGCGIPAQAFLVLLLGGVAVLIVLLPGFRQTLPARLFYLTPVTLLLLLLLYSLGFSILRSFHPRLTLTVTPGTGVPGAEAEVRWEATGGPGGVKRFTLLLEGREEATTPGKGSRTRREVFASVPLFEGGARDFKRGLSKVGLPAGAMHSLTHGSRKILWVFRLSADVSGLPDLSEEYPYPVHPGKGGGS